MTCSQHTIVRMTRIIMLGAQEAQVCGSYSKHNTITSVFFFDMLSLISLICAFDSVSRRFTFSPEDEVSCVAQAISAQNQGCRQRQPESQPVVIAPYNASGCVRTSDMRFWYCSSRCDLKALTSRSASCLACFKRSALAAGHTPHHISVPNAQCRAQCTMRRATRNLNPLKTDQAPLPGATFAGLGHDGLRLLLGRQQALDAVLAGGDLHGRPAPPPPRPGPAAKPWPRSTPQAPGGAGGAHARPGRAPGERLVRATRCAGGHGRAGGGGGGGPEWRWGGAGMGSGGGGGAETHRGCVCPRPGVGPPAGAHDAVRGGGERESARRVSMRRSAVTSRRGVGFFFTAPMTPSEASARGREQEVCFHVKERRHFPGRVGIVIRHQ